MGRCMYVLTIITHNPKYLCFILSYDISYDRELEGDTVLYDMSYNRMFLSISRIKYVPAKMLLFRSHD